MWTIMMFIVIGMVAGWAASLLIRGEMRPTDWGVLFIIGIAGSLIAGLLINLIVGGMFRIQPAGIIASVAAACLLLWVYTRVKKRRPARAAAASGPHRERKGGRKRRKRR